MRFPSLSMMKSVFAKKGGEWLGDFRKVLDESSIEADMPKKVPQVFNGTW